MAEWEEKLGAILNDPQAMSQIMSIAQSLGGKKETPPLREPETTRPPSSEELREAPPLADGLDPRLMEMGIRAMAAYQDADDRRGALLQALRPFVKPQRYAKMDKAIQIAKLSKVVRAVLEGLKGEGHV